MLSLLFWFWQVVLGGYFTLFYYNNNNCYYYYLYAGLHIMDEALINLSVQSNTSTASSPQNTTKEQL